MTEPRQLHHCMGMPQLGNRAIGHEPPFRNGFAVCLVVAAMGTLACGCNSNYVIATWRCSQPNSSATDASDSFEVPWSTGFEDGFCEYLAGGYCTPDEHEIVDSPVHSGHFAAAYTVTSSREQSRCFREGVLPERGLYGAWFYVPSATKADVADDWNLVHFQEYNDSRQGWDNTFDVLLLNDESGGLRMQVWDQIQLARYDLSRDVSIPIGAWFHVELLIKRATDKTGEIVLFQDGTTVLDKTDLITESSARGQWYVGNYWATLHSSESTIYVDDVTVSVSP